MDGFQKLHLGNTPPEKNVHSGATHAGSSHRKNGKFRFPRWLSITLIVVLVIGVLSVFGIVLPAKNVYDSAKQTYAQVQALSGALKSQNIELAQTELKKTQESLDQTQKDLHAMSYLRFIPIANFYYNDADHLTNAGQYGLETGQILLDSVAPYADVLGLKGDGTFVGGSAEDRIKTAVLTMGKITPNIDKIDESLQKVQGEIDKVDPNHYPEIIFGPKIKEQLTEVRTLTEQASSFVKEAKPLVKVLPSLLGEDEQKKYLVLFQNDKELRATGGFITAYAILTIDKGVIKVERSEDIYELDNTISGKPKAPEPILKYLPGVSVWNLRDTNLSPDFITSMDDFQTLYDKATRGVDVDGIIAIDTNVLVSTIKILDDSVTAGGITFTTQNDPRCDCPQVIYELEDNISRPVNFIREDRKGLLGDLMFAIMDKALKSSPGQYWGPLFQTFIKEVQEKHVLFDLFDKDAQGSIEALNAAGQIRPFDGDYLHINDVNFSGAKSNLFTTQNVTMEYEVANDGTITKTLTINYANTHEPSDCNLERGALCLNAEHRDFVRVYVPKGSTLIESKGSEVKVETKEDLDKTVFEGFLTVRPLGKAVYTLKYKLPFKVDGDILPVLIQKQPGTFDNEYTIKVNGKTRDKFPLLTDQEFDLKI